MTGYIILPEVYARVIEAIGEYYLPNLQYSTSSLIGGKPFKDPQVNNIDISSNFIFDDTLPENHYSSIFNLLKKEYRLFKNKGDIYFSPLRINKPSREDLYKFYKLKSQSPVPTFLYIIQRL